MITPAAAEYPRLVAVETTNHCNAKCAFCPNNALARDKGPMDQDLFEKIIEDCREFPLRAIEPFIQGDPFSDPKIMQRLEHIKRRLPHTSLRLYTNGYGMAPKRIDGLAEIGLDKLYISLNTLDAERYRSVMGIPLDRTLRNLDYLFEPQRRNKVAKTIVLRMARLDDTSLEEQDEFIAYCKERGVRPMITGLYNYKGDVPSTLPTPSYGCEHVSRVDILASGDTTLCCMDQDGEYGWGDVRTQSVLEVYRGARALHYRKLHATGRRREVEPCNTCNHYWPGFHGMSPREKVRAGAEYCAYVLKHRPDGRKAPLMERRQEGSLIQLKRKSEELVASVRNQSV